MEIHVHGNGTVSLRLGWLLYNHASARAYTRWRGPRVRTPDTGCAAPFAFQGRPRTRVEGVRSLTAARVGIRAGPSARLRNNRLR